MNNTHDVTPGVDYPDGVLVLGTTISVTSYDEILTLAATPPKRCVTARTVPLQILLMHQPLDTSLPHQSLRSASSGAAGITTVPMSPAITTATRNS